MERHVGLNDRAERFAQEGESAHHVLSTVETVR